MQTINLHELWLRKRQGLIRVQELYEGTPDHLLIWNYTQKCAVSRTWDEYTTKARGLITRGDGTIHARSFDKFFNLGEPPGPSLSELPNEQPTITTKLDGFLGISYWDSKRKQVRIASRGSFGSEYATWATDWLHQHNKYALDVPEAEPYTFVFEILHPQRIVVKRETTGLVLLAAFDNETGKEMDRLWVVGAARLHRWPVVDAWHTKPGGDPYKPEHIYTLADVIEIAGMLKGVEQEGFVVHYPTSGLRVKIKGEDYCRIHKAVTHLSDKLVWRALAGEIELSDLLEITNNLPLEHQQYIKDKQQEFLQAFNSEWECVQNIAIATAADRTRKEIVAELQERYPNYWHVVLSYLDGNEARAKDMIWRKLKPRKTTFAVEEL